MTEYAPFPEAVDDIRHDLEIRRQAIRIMMAEISALQSHLRKRMTPLEWLQYQSEVVESSREGAFSMMQEPPNV